MSESEQQNASENPGGDSPQSFADVFRSLVGKVITCVNPESLEDAPMGYQLTTGFYRVKILAVNAEFVTVATELVHKGRDATKEPVRQYIPLDAVKRISIAKSDILIHL